MSENASLHPWDWITLRSVRDNAGLKEVEFHEALGSTNTRALERLRSGDWESPTLILAHEQTAGRGRGANRWWSAPGSLTLSLLLLPSDPSPDLLAPLTLRAGLGSAIAVDQALRSGSVAPSHSVSGSSPEDQPRYTQLKWPNDLLLANRKVAGLLVERVADRPGIVIGIGLNVNQDFASAPDEIRSRATSLFEHDGQTRDLPTVLIVLARNLITQLSAGANESWVGYFRDRCALTGKVVEVGQGNQRVIGRCEGIDAGGRLGLVTEQGRVWINSGSILSVTE